LSVFIDAIEWVEMPNTRGMSQYADGGFLASKPYVSSGKYIQRMSDYCQGCTYNIDERGSEDACPFNSLYWAFLHRHQSTLGNNQRMAMMYSNLKRIPAAELTDILNRADAVRRDPDAF
jgi:deoxyribodipyrimidine photolyase-related protein